MKSQGISDQDFLNMISAARWSTTNEHWDELYKEVANKKGTFIGTGQAFSWIANGGFEDAVLIDFNPFVTEAFLPIKAALIALSRGPEDYINFLDSQKQYGQEIWDRMKRAYPDLANFPKAEIFWNTMFQKERGIFKWSKVVHMAQQESQNSLSWLGSQENFLKIKDMIHKDRIHFLTLDWFSETSIKIIQDFLKNKSISPASVFHFSNIFEWLNEDEYDERMRKINFIVGNVKSFLIDEKVMLISHTPDALFPFKSSPSLKILTGDGIRDSGKNIEGLDKAMISSESIEINSMPRQSDDPRFTNDNLKGGIDFTTENIPLTTLGQEIDFAMPVDFENLTPQDIQGLVPVIINIVPITNFNMILGLELDEELKMSKID